MLVDFSRDAFALHQRRIALFPDARVSSSYHDRYDALTMELLSFALFTISSVVLDLLFTWYWRVRQHGLHLRDMVGKRNCSVLSP